jgi:hypothetical protein
MASTPHPDDWKTLYQLAMMEADTTMLPQRISDAYHAILDRIEDFRTQAQDPERELMQDALNGLQMRRREYERRLQRT